MTEDDDGSEHWDEDWSEDAEPFCAHCQNQGIVQCRCGGDLCVCKNGGEAPCLRCDRWETTWP